MTKQKKIEFFQNCVAKAQRDLKSWFDYRKNLNFQNFLKSYFTWNCSILLMVSKLSVFQIFWKIYWFTYFFIIINFHIIIIAETFLIFIQKTVLPAFQNISESFSVKLVGSIMLFAGRAYIKSQLCNEDSFFK